MDDYTRLNNLYDRLCAALTHSEEDDGSGDAGDAGDRLYCELCGIQNDFDCGNI